MNTILGRLKKGDLFRLYKEQQLYMVTASGFGRPFVEFIKYPDGINTYSSVHKNNVVEKIERVNQT